MTDQTSNQGFFTVEQLHAIRMSADSTDQEQRLARQCVQLLDQLLRQKPDETSDADRKLIQQIFDRHNRVNKLLYGGPRETILGPMDSDEAHRDRGRLLSLMPLKQIGVVQPEETSERLSGQALQPSPHLSPGTNVRLTCALFPGQPADGWIVETVDQPTPLKYRLRHTNGSLIDVLAEFLHPA